MKALRREWATVLVLTVLTVSLLTVAFGPWRLGSAGVGVAVLIAMVLRLFLPAAAVGMLAVRGRVFDVITMLLIGGAVVVFAVIVPGVG